MEICNRDGDKLRENKRLGKAKNEKLEIGAKQEERGGSP